ncbi:unnamed protein product, partial [Vitis vinifera]
MSDVLVNDTFHIRDVWDDNLEDEIRLIRGLLDDYPYIAMDTEFPGVVLRSVGNFKNNNEYCVWQFNFREFNLNEDVFAHDSIELLKQSGIDFKKNNEKGVDARRFSELLMSSGIVLNESVHWVTFHSGLHGGLNKLAELLGVERIGSCHQAGSDSLLTCCTFMKLKKDFFNGSPEKYAGVLYGLGVESG